MKTKATVLLAMAAALLLTASLAAAEMVKDAGSLPGPPAMIQTGPMGGPMGGGMTATAVTLEKQREIRTIQSKYAERLFSLRQDIRAKQAELNAIMLQLQPDTVKAKSTYRDIAALQVKEADTLIDMHARISTETDVRLPMLHTGPCSDQLKR